VYGLVWREQAGADFSQLHHVRIRWIRVVVNGQDSLAHPWTMVYICDCPDMRERYILDTVLSDQKSHITLHETRPEDATRLQDALDSATCVHAR